MDIATSPEIRRKLDELAEIIGIEIELDPPENPCQCRYIRMMGHPEDRPNRITITIKVE